MMLQWMRLQQEFRLRSSNPEPLMSALGQKQTLRRIRAMSALPPKADMVQHGSDVRFVPKDGVIGRRFCG